MLWTVSVQIKFKLSVTYSNFEDEPLVELIMWIYMVNISKIEKILQNGKNTAY